MLLTEFCHHWSEDGIKKVVKQFMTSNKQVGIVGTDGLFIRKFCLQLVLLFCLRSEVSAQRFLDSSGVYADINVAISLLYKLRHLIYAIHPTRDDAGGMGGQDNLHVWVHVV